MSLPTQQQKRVDISQTDVRSAIRVGTAAVGGVKAIVGLICSFNFQLKWLSFSYKLVKILSVCVWLLTRVAEVVTAAHRDL